jgi:hypothetical protein
MGLGGRKSILYHGRAVTRAERRPIDRMQPGGATLGIEAVEYTGVSVVWNPEDTGV